MPDRSGEARRRPGGVLGEIVARKREEVAARLHDQPIEALRERAEPTDRSLAAALAGPGARFVMEMKRTSPSKGASAGHEPAEVARAYAGVADAMSVLTDAPYFGGSFDDLAAARAIFPGPVLCKDFTVDPRQIPEARAWGADAVLVMLSVLGDAEAAACIAEAARLGMDALVEVHDEEELRRALALGARIVGINNRDLQTLETDLAVTERLAPLVADGPGRPLLVSESGIAEHSDVLRLAPLVDGFLVGSSLMAQADIAGAARRLVHGRVKICGLTREEDIEAAQRSGASMGGLIFVAGSPREVTPRTSAMLAFRGHELGLPLVGVFRDDPIDRVIFLADRYGLAAVQMHGNEDGGYLAALRERLAADCEIWTTVPVEEGAPIVSRAGDRTLFDTRVGGQTGGTGRSFDWSRIAGRPELERGLIAGGLSPDNAAEAARLGAWALDVNSSVEDAPGVKSPDKLAALFEALRPGAREGARPC
jgi:indole-3-glycerol phosphate synthase/phosphoribosylanthranilate isomerase